MRGATEVTPRDEECDSLERQLQRKLKTTRCLRRESRRRNHSEAAACETGVGRVRELRRIRRVEGLSPELEADGFGEVEVLEDG